MPLRPDVIVVGGGPAGSVAGTLLSRAGHAVALFEEERFPRFHVGESLIPAVNRILGRIGVLDAMDGRGFPRKHGVQFILPDGPTRPFYFTECRSPDLHQTWQVLRSSFDGLLLDHAARAGVEVATGTKVLDVLDDGGGVTGVRIRRPDGAEEEVRARVVIDASGLKSLLARQRSRREIVGGLRNLAVFAHYRGAVRDSGIDAGNTLIYRLDHASWIWFIPLPETDSVGLVAPADRISGAADPPAAILDQAIASCPPLRERLRAAERVTVTHVVRDFSYRATDDGGPGWLLAGDALAFIDPIYSTGVHLGFLSADLAARAVDAALRNGSGPVSFAGYASSYRVAFERFLVLARAFYSEDFHFGPFSRNPVHREGLVALLAGDHDIPAAIEVARYIGKTLDG